MLESGQCWTGGLASCGWDHQARKQSSPLNTETLGPHCGPHNTILVLLSGGSAVSESEHRKTERMLLVVPVTGGCHRHIRYAEKEMSYNTQNSSEQ